MGSDRARRSFDADQQYRAVVMQQGRVFVEADWNENQEILGETVRAETLDIVGPSGTPDDGYAISFPNPLPANWIPFDFAIKHGTMYVGGLRVFLPTDATYFIQPDWIDPDQPYWVNPDQPSPGSPSNEIIYLLLAEQEVSAVEDSALRDVAFGGPDTAQRLRLLQRIARQSTGAATCDAAFSDVVKAWAANGLTFDTASMQLKSGASLKVSLDAASAPPDPCQPSGQGGYLGAENQLIRVQVAAPGELLWGFDNASFLYQVQVDPDLKTLTLQSRPVDAFHQPRKDQYVEVLRSAARLHNGAYVAEATGEVQKLAEAYHSDTGKVVLNQPLSSSVYLDAKKTPRVFLRVWEEQLDFTSGTPVTLGHTGLQVTLQGGPFPIGDYWLIAARPRTPLEVYPERYLSDFQWPDGPRRWACPLAVIGWNDSVGTFLDNCRLPFDNLVELTKRRGTGCCTVTVRPEDLTAANTLQAILDRYQDKEAVTVCLMPGTYELPASLRLGPGHSHLTLEGCHDGAILTAAPGADDQFADGLIVLTHANNVTLRRLRFRLPLAPLAALRGRLPRVNLSALGGQMGVSLTDLRFSIGIRPLHCAELAVEDCLFRFSFGLPPALSILGIGIFAGSECWGLKVEGNRFVHDEEFLRDGTLRILIGFALTPSSRFIGARADIAEVNQPLMSLVVRPLLQDACFRNNRFAGLSIAALILADTGMVRFEENTVRDCPAGFWLLSLRSLVISSDLQTYVVGRSPAAELQGMLLALILDPLIQIGSVLARVYPLPAEFELRGALRVGPRRTTDTASPKAVPARRLSEAFLERALSVFGGLPHGSESEAAGGPGSAAGPFVAAAGRPTAVRGRLPRPGALSLRLTALEQAAFAQIAGKRGLHLSLHFAHNQIDAFVEGGPSSLPVVVWDTDLGTPSSMLLTANTIRNRTPAWPTAFALMVERCTVTGNQVLNEAPDETQNPKSLILLPRPTPQRTLVAVTGNVFRGHPVLPPRSDLSTNVPAPMNTWDFLNTEL
jgi:hypothetical protein